MPAIISAGKLPPFPPRTDSYRPIASDHDYNISLNRLDQAARTVGNYQ